MLAFANDVLRVMCTDTSASKQLLLLSFDHSLSVVAGYLLARTQ
jgi:hypothetical protein